MFLLPGSAVAQSQTFEDRPQAPPLETITRADGTEIVAGELIVTFKDGATSAQRSKAVQAVDSEGTRNLRVEDTKLIELEDGTSVAEAAAELRQLGNVASVQPNHVYRQFAVPNDPLFGQMWGLRDTLAPVADINATAAWDTTTGDENTRVAVIDSGVEALASDPPNLQHPDLFPNVNQELSRNFSFPDYYDPEDWWDGSGHGTHVAGTVAAQGDNGLGVSGVAWDADLVAIRVLSGIGGTDEWIANGIDYAGDIDSRVANLSLGGPFTSQLVRDALESHPDTLYVIAAGNGLEYGDPEVGDDVDATPVYPCAYAEELSNAICVANLQKNGELNVSSNYGDETVHLAAPGTGILSTLPPWNTNPPYDLSTGTSMASPHVAGAAVLAFSEHPQATPADVKNALVNSATPMASLSGKTISGGRLNADAALRATWPYESQCTGPGGSVYRTEWARMTGGTTIDVANILKKGPGQATFTNFHDTWGEVAKMEWWTANTVNEMFPSGAWGNPLATLITNAWDYAHWWSAVDQRAAILSTNPIGSRSPRVSYRNNGDGLARAADVCNNYLSAWPPRTNPSHEFTAIVGDSMAVQTAKKFRNTANWSVWVEPQAQSSYATMLGELRGAAAGLIYEALELQLPPERLVMVLGTRDADAIGAIANATQRAAALNTFKANVDTALADTTAAQCRIVVTVHETGWKADGSYSAEQLQARKDVNAKLRAVASASSSVDIVDWQALSAGHEATKPAGTRWYEPTDRDNLNPAGATAFSNAVINKAQGSCS